MTNDELILVLTEKFPDAAIAQGNQYVEMTVTAASLHETAQLLKETETFSFDYLFCLTGVDYPENMGMSRFPSAIGQFREVILP